MRLPWPVASDFPLPSKSSRRKQAIRQKIGGVALGPRDETEVRAAAQKMQMRLHAINPSAALNGFLVQEMVSGLEIILGVREDPQFGPYMLVGVGGIQVEVIRDVAIRL